MTTPDVLEAAKPWMQQCGPHDYGVDTAPCGCPPDGDPRPIVSKLASELESARAALLDRREAETRGAAAIGAVRRLCRQSAEPFALDVLKAIDAALNGEPR